MPHSKKLLVAFSFLSAFQSSYLSSAAAEKEREIQFTVPVYYVGDRRPPGLHTGDKTRYQMIGNQNIQWGPVDVPIKISERQFNLIKNSKELGWKEHKSKPISVRKQLSKAPSSAMNYDAGGGTMTVFSSPTFKMLVIDPFLKYLKDCKAKEFIYFVHGCCSSDEQSFERAAQLAVLAGKPIFMFDWATPGILESPVSLEFNSYRRSERVLEISNYNYHELTSALAKHIDIDCILVGHSMGNRIIFSDLLRRCKPGELIFRQIHFIRPDMSLPAYILEERNACKFGGKFFIYCANNDPWLAQSQWLSAGVPRLGRPDSNFFDLAFRQGWSMNGIDNRFFLDVSALKKGHEIPADLFASLVNYGLKDTDKFEFKPLSDEHTKANYLLVSRKDCNFNKEASK